MQLPNSMRAIYIVREGDVQKAFEIREVPIPKPEPHEILIKVHSFGLNFADVMARQGLYRDRPPLPCVIGYDVAGEVAAVGSEISDRQLGQRVTAMTRFGGYAEYAVTDARATAVIDEDFDYGEATALCTQYSTAWYASEYVARIRPGDQVLIHAAAGGVGTALVQIAKHRGATIFGTAGSAAKLDILREAGVDYPINYRTQDWVCECTKVVGDRGMDFIFDSIGADYVKKGKKLLGAGGRLVCFGAASMSGITNPVGKLRKGLAFGLYHPAEFLMNSQSLIGVNMLRIADHRQDVIAWCLEGVVQGCREGWLKPKVGARFKTDQIADAQTALETRKTTGKVVVSW